MPLSRDLVGRPPQRREWSGIRQACPLCYRTMDMIVERGREVYECPECVATYVHGVQLELLEE